MPGPGLALPAAVDYIGPERAAAVETREFHYDVLVRPLEGRMMRSIWRIVREREAAEDALQDALALIWKKRDIVARHPKPEALILRIAVSAAFDAARRNRRRLRHEVPGLPDERVDEASPAVGKEIEDRDLHATILDAIGRLPERQATAVLLHIVEEQSYADIARAMGCSEPTVRVHVMRGRERLARRLARELPGVVDGSEGPGHESEEKDVPT